MKWAEAKTRLSFVTATLKFLWAGTPAPFEQHQVARGAGQVRRGAGIQRVGFVPQLAVEGGDRLPSRGRAPAPGVEHAASSLLHGDRSRQSELAGDVGIGRGGEERQVRLDDRVPPGEAVGERGPEGRSAQLERGPEVARVFAGDRVALDRHGHQDRKSTRLNSSHSQISYAVFCLKKKKEKD